VIIKSLSQISLIAPCGMNCGICMAYLREKNHCSSCRGTDTNKPNACVRCVIINCKTFQKGRAKYCFECDNMPCDRLKNLDKRYRTKYNMSMLENLEYIRKHGIRKFVKRENIRWTCTKCGGKINVHRGNCVECGKIFYSIPKKLR
jgi:hypothetical protein